MVLIVLAYYAAHALVFGPASQAIGWQFFLRTLPAAVALGLAALLVAGVYRGLWRYARLSDVLNYTLGVLLGSLATLVYGRLPLKVAAIYALLLLGGIAASRFAFRLLRKLLPLPHERSSVTGAIAAMR